jgi:hypothetical protein
VSRSSTINFNQPQTATPDDLVIFAWTAPNGATVPSCWIPIGEPPAPHSSPPAPNEAFSLILNKAGRLTNLRIQSSTPAAFGPEIFTVYINGAPTTLTCSIAVGNYVGTNDTATLLVSAGDCIMINWDAGSSGTWFFFGGSMTFTPTP